jgi:hypothetical protein
MTTNLFTQMILTYSEFCLLIEATPEELKLRPNKDSFAPFAEPLGDMTQQEHKDRNASHVFWKGHLPSWNHEYQIWEPHPHNIWGGQIEFAKDASGKIKRDSMGKRIATEVKPNSINGLIHIRSTLSSNIHDGGFNAPSYQLAHKIDRPNNGKSFIVAYSQHFMARLHDASEVGDQNFETGTPRKWLSPLAIHKIITNIHREIRNNPNYDHENGIVAISKSSNFHIPIKIDRIGGKSVYTMTTHLPRMPASNTRKSLIVECH